MSAKPLILAALLLATPAAAQDAGAWRAFGGDGACAMESRSGTRAIRITWELATADVTFRLSREGWRIPPGLSLPVAMQVDRAEPIAVRSARGSGEDLSFTTDRERFAGFVPQFSSGTTLRIAFPDGDEPTWLVSLRGSFAAYAAFWRCLQAGRDAGTQPFRDAPRRWEDRPTQPFRGQVPL